MMKKVEKTRSSKQEFVYQVESEGVFPPALFPPKLGGIIAHLTRECGGNVRDSGIVNVTARSVSWANSDCQSSFAQQLL